MELQIAPAMRRNSRRTNRVRAASPITWNLALGTLIDTSVYDSLLERFLSDPPCQKVSYTHLSLSLRTPHHCILTAQQQHHVQANSLPETEAGTMMITSTGHITRIGARQHRRVGCPPSDHHCRHWVAARTVAHGTLMIKSPQDRTHRVVRWS
ncbi:CYFA0S03e04885g1_1 [Cyberlindnera fabianii]|uniref:CYFA0S03e04885g1_1 n=1 Tax=Cyberlindnera fabianii TaxID=36022 RepID=A0A061AXX8_CYBFA|nr:CYFA0S03e04885g1_1 [Cyberlindnera fabianii]